METSNLLLQINPTAVLTLGDLQYEAGQYQNFLRFYDPSWGRLKARTHPAPGNHEYETSGAQGYYDYFNGIGNFTGPAGDRNKGYYSYDIGAWHLIALNSNCSAVGGCGAGSPQEQWLRQDLAAHSNPCTLAYWHHPRFSSGEHGSSTDYQALWQALYDARADLVLVGHDHDYERFAPQTPAGALDSARGIRQIVVGTGGRSLRGFGTIRANSEVRNSNTFGVLKVTLRTASYDWEFVPIAGQSFTDRGSGACRNALRAVTSVSSASFKGDSLAPESIVAAFGSGLANTTQSTTALPLPTTLGGTTVRVKDGTGVERLAPLLFVSPGQVNYQVPPATAAGVATITITAGDGTVSVGTARITATAPGLYTANANGHNVAAGSALRVKADGTQSYEPLAQFDNAQRRFVARPIEFGATDEQLFLVLFGTGIRFRSSLATVTATIGGEPVEVLYAGPQNSFVGLDQVNLRLPRSLAGRGEVTVILSVDGQPANAVTVAVR